MGNCRDGVGTGTEVVTMGTVVVGTWMEIGIEDIWERGGNGYSVYGDGRGWGLISVPVQKSTLKQRFCVYIGTVKVQQMHCLQQLVAYKHQTGPMCSMCSAEQAQGRRL